MPRINKKNKQPQRHSDPMARTGRQLGSGRTVGPAKTSAVKRKKDDDEYIPDTHEHSPSPEGPEAEEVAQELAEIEEELADITDARGNFLGQARVGGTSGPQEDSKTVDKLAEEIKKKDEFKENSIRLAMRMHLTWERAQSDEATKDDRYIDAGEFANDKDPSQYRKLEPCKNGGYIKKNGKFRQLDDEELRRLGKSHPCFCHTCKKQRDFDVSYAAQSQEWKSTKTGKSFNSVGEVLGSG